MNPTAVAHETEKHADELAEIEAKLEVWARLLTTAVEDVTPLVRRLGEIRTEIDQAAPITPDVEDDFYDNVTGTRLGDAYEHATTLATAGDTLHTEYARA